ncbi:hypothetical protein [Methyloradius palustris]|uniref:hypothetical protein n=1 Tax=Methyloradius palustris TaxID=2778876 RepID=UPI001C8C4CE1|nr:hypothetical protein [Methyloradius palustris]
MKNSEFNLPSFLCLSTSVLGWFIAVSGWIYGLSVDNKLINNPHISYDHRVIFQYSSILLGAFICFIGICSSLIMLRYFQKNSLFLGSIAIGGLFLAIFFSYVIAQMFLSLMGR